MEDKNLTQKTATTTVESTDIFYVVTGSGSLDRYITFVNLVAEIKTDLNLVASDISDFDTEVGNNSAVVLNTAKDTYPSADSTKVGYLTVTQAVDLDTMESDITTNNSKVTNVPTSLSAGTISSITYGITSDGGSDDIVLPEANVSQAGLLGSGKWSEIVANTLKVTFDNTASTKVGHISVSQAVNLDTIESDTATNNSKVSNATHTGDVTGSTALTISAGAVDIAMLSASGTPSSSTFLRGDNTWDTPAGSASPLTTKGDLYTYSTVDTRLALGTNGYILSVNTSTATGLEWILASGSGDMLASVYDPTNVAGDAFDMDNMVEGTATKILTATERSEIAANTLKISFNSTASTKVGHISVTQAVDLDTMEDDIATNNAKVSNVSTQLSEGTVTTTTYGITSDGGANDLIIGSASSFAAGILTASQFDAINTNSSKVTYPGSADATELNILDGATLTTVELNYVDGVTSAIQTQLDSKGVLDNVVEDTTPQLGGNLDLNNKALTRIETAGEGLINGNLCYLKSDGKYWKADASAVATAKTDLLIATATISADATGTFVEYGEYTTTGLTAGSVYFMSETTGGFTATAPTTSGAIVRAVGTALSTTVLKFKPDTSWAELN